MQDAACTWVVQQCYALSGSGRCRRGQHHSAACTAVPSPQRSPTLQSGTQLPAVLVLVLVLMLMLMLMLMLPQTSPASASLSMGGLLPTQTCKP